MSWLTENPWPVIWIAAVAEGLLLLALVSTRRGAVLIAMGVVLAVAAGLLVVERLIVTETEEVELALDSVARALEANDLDAALACLAPEAGGIRADAQRHLPRIEVTAARVGGDLTIHLNHLTDPPTARAEFTGRITGRGRGSAEAFPYDNLVRRFLVKLRKDPQTGRWLLTEYETDSPLDGGR